MTTGAPTPDRVTGKVRLLALVLAAAVACGGLAWMLLGGPQQHTVTAVFAKTVGLFEGSDVRVMGMRVGSVQRITPEGTGVRVVMTYDAQYPLPADVKAVIVAPSVISDRFVQLTPGYVSGPVLADGAVLPEASTRVPVELDDSLATATDLFTALGPDGVNRHGALSASLRSIAGVLRGNGGSTRAALRDLAGLTDTLAAVSPDAARTIDHLSRLGATLAANDRQVGAFNQRLSAVATALADDSTDLSATLATLARALGDVAAFVRNNRGLVARNVRQLGSVATALVAERQALAEILDIAPLAFTNLTETYDPYAKAVRTRANFGEVAKILDRAVCDALIKQAGPSLEPTCDRLHTLLAGAGR
jgi:phospholipid/cholesterol/gamma-HCH transport system substrate-binding protein